MNVDQYWEETLIFAAHPLIHSPPLPNSVPFGECYTIEDMPTATGIEVLGEIP